MPVGLLLASVGLAHPESVDEVVKALSSRDPISCAVIESFTSTPADTLLHVVDTVTLPPWAPMRAADCLLRGHAAAVQPAIEKWVVDPELKGLGRMVLTEIDLLPVAVAVPVARKALSGPLAELAGPRIAASAHAEVRAVGMPE